MRPWPAWLAPLAAAFWKLRRMALSAGRRAQWMRAWRISPLGDGARGWDLGERACEEPGN
jgi:hypothetical protein